MQESPCGDIKHRALEPNWIHSLHYTAGNHKRRNVVTQSLFGPGFLVVGVTWRRWRRLWLSLVHSSGPHCVSVSSWGLLLVVGAFSRRVNPTAPSVQGIRLLGGTWTNCSFRGIVFRSRVLLSVETFRAFACAHVFCSLTFSDSLDKVKKLCFTQAVFQEAQA